MSNESESPVMPAMSPPVMPILSQFICIWQGKKILIEAPSIHFARSETRARFDVPAKRAHEIIVMLADTEHSLNALPGS